MFIIVEQSCIVIPYFNGLYVFMTKGGGRRTVIF